MTKPAVSLPAAINGRQSQSSSLAIIVQHLSTVRRYRRCKNVNRCIVRISVDQQLKVDAAI